MNYRKIIHIDMDAFYASVEQRDNPAYRGKPIVVGGSPDKRGAVAAASYEARKYGVHSAMPSRTAIQKCPHLIFVKPRFEVYRAISEEIRGIFARYTELIEPLALDEAYLDVTANKLGIPSATWIAQEIRAAIHQETGLTASAGISINKFLAKVASGMNKPNGQFLITPEAAVEFVETLPISRFHGIGQVTAHKLQQMGIFTGADLKQWSEADLVQRFGKMGAHYYRIARAEDHRPVNPNRERKSIGAEKTFEVDLEQWEALSAELTAIAHKVEERLAARQAAGRTLTLKVRYANFQLTTRCRTVATWLWQAPEIAAIALELLTSIDLSQHKVRLLGITLSNLGSPNSTESEHQQLTLEF